MPSEAMDDGSVFHCFIASGKKLFCMNRSCSSLFGIGGGILVSVSVPVSQWLVRGRLLAYVEFYKTWLVLLSATLLQGLPFSCRIMSVGELILWYRLNTNRAARRWTFSMLLVYFYYRVRVPHWRAVGYSSMASLIPRGGYLMNF